MFIILSLKDYENNWILQKRRLLTIVLEPVACAKFKQPTILNSFIKKPSEIVKTIYIYIKNLRISFGFLWKDVLLQRIRIRERQDNIPIRRRCKKTVKCWIKTGWGTRRHVHKRRGHKLGMPMFREHAKWTLWSWIQRSIWMFSLQVIK